MVPIRGVAAIDPVAVGERIASARQYAGLHQRELAERIGFIPRSVQNYEAGRVPWRYLDKIAEAVGRSKEWLLYGDGDDEAAPAAAASQLDRIESKLDEILRRIK